MNNILITGGCGFIPSSFVNYLKEEEASTKIVIYDRMNLASNKLNVQDIDSERCILVAGDVCDRVLLDKTLLQHNIDTVVHFAALTSVCDSFSFPHEFVRSNVQGTVTLLEAMRNCGGIKRFLYISTDEVYGESTEDGKPKKEGDYHKPTNPYSASKLSAEHFVDIYRLAYGIPATCVRMCNIYGPRQSLDKVIPKFIKLAMEDKPFSIQGDGSQLRCWLHVSDACKAIYSVLLQGMVGEVYNIGSNIEMSVLDIAKKLGGAVAARLGKQNYMFKTTPLKDRPYNDCRYLMDSSKIRMGLGWSEEVSFEAGILSTIDWYIENSSKTPERERILVYGARGWIGGQFLQLLKDKGIDFVRGSSRIGEDSDRVVEDEILETAPTHVASFIGRTHGPGNNTIDYLEGGPDKLTVNLRDNLFAPLVLAEICKKHFIHFTYIGSGCIFTYTDERPLGSAPFTEDDVPNFYGSSYSVVKGFTDRLMHHHDNVLNIRMRLPISDQINPRNLITKLAAYHKITSIPNSVTVLPDLLPALLELMRKRHIGTVNLVNHDSIEHTEILSEYIEQVDPSHTYELVSINEPTEFARSLKKKRSNCHLDTKVLGELCPQIANSKEAVKRAIKKLSAVSG